MKFENLSIRRGSQYIVTSATLEFPENGITAVVGPSGAGKTSFLFSLGGIGQSAGLEVTCKTFNSADSSIANPTAENGLRGSIVFQDAALYDELSVAQNLELIASNNPPPDAATLSEVEKLLEGIGSDQLPNTLSGGQRQRVAIARSLYSDHHLLLMDEPNSGLDLIRSQVLVDTIGRVAKTGRHVVVTTHHPEPFLAHATQVLFLDGKGRIEAVTRSIDGVRKAFSEAAQANQQSLAPVGEIAIQRKSHAQWILKFFSRDLWSLVLAPSNVLYVGIACALLAFTATYVTIIRYPFSGVLLDLTLDVLVVELGAANFRFTVPMLVSILVAARSGALVTTNVSMKSMSGETIALKLLRVPINFYRQTSLLLVLALSTLIMYAIGIVITLLMISIAVHIATGTPLALLRALVVADIVGENGSLVSWPWILSKTLLSGFAIGVVSLFIGQRRANSGRDITSSASLAILCSVLAVIGLHSLLIVLELGI